MKNVLILTALLCLMTAGAAHAQRTPVVDERQQEQNARIRQGINSGEVSRKEAAKLRAEQRHIRRAERRAKADGNVTRRERAKLHRQQNKAGADIRKQKND